MQKGLFLTGLGLTLSAATAWPLTLQTPTNHELLRIAGRKHRECVQGSGTSKGEQRTVTEFTQIDVRGYFQVRVAAQKEQRIEISADDNILPHLTTTVSDGRLVVSADEPLCPKRDMVVTIGVGSLESLAASGLAELEASDLKSRSLDVNISGAEKATLSGQVEELDIKMTGAASVNAKELRAQSVTVEIQGSGDADVFASQALNARIVGVGNVRYSGNPAKVDKSILGLGSVVQQ